MQTKVVCIVGTVVVFYRECLCMHGHTIFALIYFVAAQTVMSTPVGGSEPFLFLTQHASFHTLSRAC